MTDDTLPPPPAGGPGAELPSEPGDRVQLIEIEDELQRSYLDYAMSVIVGRALPSVQDGLKPVHRRILFSMFEGGMRAGTQHRKSAAAVGDVMKKYHPHGDSAIYDALVRMGQDWAIRYPLIDGHGNFGSVDGDPAAAMRYTESRLSPLAMELLRDIDEDTVDFIENYDGQEEEPVVLPSRFPNLLVNGSSGIAVGMATNIPPHNLVEMTAAVIATIRNPDISLDELMTHVPGPDFPTGALIMGTQGIRDAYETGRGSIRMRAVCEVEETGGPGAAYGEQIVVTELPYQVNKANLAVKIADLVKSKQIDGIRDLQDNSNRDGMRLVIELKRDANAQVVLNQLYKKTQLQDTFGVINLSLVDGVPRTLSLKDTITAYVRHQVEIVTRRTRYRLRKAEERAHVLQGLIVALDHLDEVIALIRGAASADAALGQLQERFALSEVQARAILDMQLRRLAALERQRILDEFAQLQEIISDLRACDDPDAARRHRVFATKRRMVKRTPLTDYDSPRSVLIAINLREDDELIGVQVTDGSDEIVLVSKKAMAIRFAETDARAMGRDTTGVIGMNLAEGDELLSATKVVADGQLLVVTDEGYGKRTPLERYPRQRRGGKGVKTAQLVEVRGELVGALVAAYEQEIFLVTDRGTIIRMDVKDIRPTGRATQGVRVMKPSEGAKVASVAPVMEGEELEG